MISLSAHPHQPTHHHRSSTGPKREFTTTVPQVSAIPEFLGVGNSLWLSMENMVLTVHYTIFFPFFLCKDSKCITVNFNTRTYKGTAFQLQSCVLVRQLKQCVIKRELYTVQNLSRPEPRQGAANSFVRLITSALNSALQASTTTFITCLPAIYSFPIQSLLKECQSYHLIPTMPHQEFSIERLTSVCQHCTDCCKNTRMQILESRLVP